VALSWETNRDVLPLFEQQRYAEIKPILTAAIEEYEHKTHLLYNLACVEARLGETDAAIDHLAASIAGDTSVIPMAVEDDDLETLRGDPRFVELTALRDA
jgi:hypothetical protein